MSWFVAFFIPTIIMFPQFVPFALNFSWELYWEYYLIGFGLSCIFSVVAFISTLGVRDVVKPLLRHITFAFFFSLLIIELPFMVYLVLDTLLEVEVGPTGVALAAVFWTIVGAGAFIAYTSTDSFRT